MFIKTKRGKIINYYLSNLFSKIIICLSQLKVKLENKKYLKFDF